MALKDRERRIMGDVALVGATVRAAKEIYDVSKPIVKKGIKSAKKSYNKIKEKRKAKSKLKSFTPEQLKQVEQTKTKSDSVKTKSRKYHNNNYKEGE